ncbi:MAG: hypothetical protein QM734_15525 [Cyclobacteriaceae bacterium]
MGSNSESGHVKNISTFEALINIILSFGSTYNPFKTTLKTATLNTLLTNAQSAMTTLRNAKTNFDTATNAREIAMLYLNKLITKLFNILSSTDASPQTIDNARAILKKFRGTRAKKIVKTANTDTTTTPTSEEGGTTSVEGGETTETKTPKTHSVSQRSVDYQIEHFSQFVSLLAAEPKYAPNENEFKVNTLNTLITDLKAKNTSVISAATALMTARLNRDKILYELSTGLVDTAKAVKLYVKGLYGQTSTQFKSISKLVFRRIKYN